jgi:hypothetical protein
MKTSIILATFLARPTFELALRVGPLRFGIALGAQGLLAAAEYGNRRWLLAIGSCKWIR